MPRESSLAYIPALDALRGIAILLVLAFHYGLLPCGWIGVQVFFVLSGYLITKILVQEKDRPLGDFLRRFFSRRALRIFPLYFAFLFVVVIAYWATGKPRTISSYWPYLFTYTFNLRQLAGLTANDEMTQDPFFHLWSLSVEEQFYLLWPSLVYALSVERLRKCLIGLICLAPLVRILVYQICLAQQKDLEFTRVFLYYFTPCQVDAFATGALLAVVPAISFEKSRIWFCLSLAAVALAGWWNQMFLSSEGLKKYSLDFGYPIHIVENHQYLWGYSLLNLCAASLLMFMLTRPWSGNGIAARSLVRVGKVSYGMYVLHVVGLIPFLTLKYNPGEYVVAYHAAFFLYVVLVWLLAELSYRFLEKPFLALKVRVE